jgi:hypothetical protein
VTRNRRTIQGLTATAVRSDVFGAGTCEGGSRVVVNGSAPLATVVLDACCSVTPRECAGAGNHAVISAVVTAH